MDKKEFGKRLRQLRRERSAKVGRDILCAEVAKAIGVSPSCYMNWEAGRGSMMRIFEAWKLADYYEMPVGELVGRILYEPQK